MLLAALTSLSLSVGIIYAQMPDSWRFGKHARTNEMIFTVFALVLACFRTSTCRAATLGMNDLTETLGSSASNGVDKWTAAQLTSAWCGRSSARPCSRFANPNPGGSPPGWFGPAALLAALGIEALSETLSPAPGSGPGAGTGLR